MKNGRTAAVDSRRRKRTRPTPKWLLESQEVEDISRRRCLLVLSVLSGEKPVTEAITEAGISRQMYYQLETRALAAMLRALTPGAEAEAGGASPALSRIAELERALQTAEQRWRRAERLLFLTRKAMGRGTVKTAAGRPRQTTRPSSTSGGRSASRRRRTSGPETSTAPSTPTPAGAGAP